jgi:hypothetical protein
MFGLQSEFFWCLLFSQAFVVFCGFLLVFGCFSDRFLIEYTTNPMEQLNNIQQTKTQKRMGTPKNSDCQPNILAAEGGIGRSQVERVFWGFLGFPEPF